MITFSNNATVQIPWTPALDVDIEAVTQEAQLTNIVEGMEVAMSDLFAAPYVVIIWLVTIYIYTHIIFTNLRAQFQKLNSYKTLSH